MLAAFKNLFDLEKCAFVFINN